MSLHELDTVPIPIVSDEDCDTLPFLRTRNPDDEDVDTGLEPRPAFPEPALLRGAVAAVAGLLALLLGRGLCPQVVDHLTPILIGVGPLGLATWIRRHVSPSKRCAE